jgi:hypothetical protein
MCFDARVSLNSLTIGISGGLALIYLGKEEYKQLNYIVGLFFILVAFMQLVDYFIWIDLDCTNNYNKIATYAGHLLTNFQPVFVFLLASYFLTGKIINTKDIVFYLNILYVIYTLYIFHEHRSKKENHCTRAGKEHLEWKWTHDFNYVFYHIMMAINLVRFFNKTSEFLPFILVYIIYGFISLKKPGYIGELWCYFANAIPLVTLLLQHINIIY